MANVTGVTKHFAVAKEGFTTTTSATIAPAATTVPLNSVTGYSNGDVVVLVIDGDDIAKKQVFTGTVDTTGVQITNVVWTEGSNTTHTAGASVVDYVAATHQGMTTKGILEEHKQDGTHGDVNADSLNVLGNSTVSGNSTVNGTNSDRGITLETYRKEQIFNYVASGLVWTGDSYGSTRNASMTAGVVYIDGVRVAVSAVVARTFDASRDTYIDVGSDGVVDYNPQTNNAASPALASGHIRIGIIVTGASSIANVGSVNQGQEDKVLPIASSIPYTTTDSLGNLLCPRDPQRKLLSLKRITSNATNSGAVAQIAGLSCPVIIPDGRKVEISVYCPKLYNTLGASNSRVTIWDGTVGSGTQLVHGDFTSSAANYGSQVTVSAPATATGSKTYNAGLANVGGTTATIDASSTFPCYMKVELK